MKKLSNYTNTINKSSEKHSHVKLNGSETSYMKNNVKSNLDVLGMATVGARERSMTKDEEGRLNSAKKTLDILKVLPISRGAKAAATRALALSKATYGWIAKSPNRTATGVIFTATKRTIGGAIANVANKHLKALLLGGTLHLSCIVLQRQLSLAQSMIWRKDTERPRILQWNNIAGGFVANLRKGMGQQGWQEKGAFTWKHQK